MLVGYLPTKFDGQKHSESGDIVILVCHVILQDHVIKMSGAAYQDNLRFCQVW